MFHSLCSLQNGPTKLSRTLLYFVFLLVIIFSEVVNGQCIQENQRSTRSSLQPSVGKSKPRFRWIIDKPSCTDPVRNAKVDEYIMKIIGFGPKGRKFPQTYAQVKPYCNETRRLVAYIDSFLYECFTPDVQKLASIVIYTLKRHLRIFCNKKPTHKKLRKLLSLMPCLNRYVEDDICVQLVMNKTQLLIPSKLNSKNKIKYVCCYYTQFEQCSDEWLEAKPCFKKDDKAVLLDFLRGLAVDIVSIACGEYNQYTDKCDNLPKVAIEPGVKYKDYGSYLLLMIDMIESMDSLLGDV